MDRIIRGVILYYALPSLVFLWGWCEPWVSIPLIALVVWGCWRAECDMPESMGMSRRNLCVFIAVAIFLLLQQWFVGYTGHFPQHQDFAARNAMFGSLCREDWPMASAEGYPMVYYIAAWLPSALLVKTAPFVDANWAFMLQNSVALIAAFYVLCCRVKQVSVWVIVGAACLTDFPSALNNAYSFILNQEWLDYQYCSTCVPRWLDLPLQTRTTVNHAPYLILAVSLVLLPLKSRYTYVLIGALLLPISPLGAIGLFPFIVWRFLQGGVRIKEALGNPVLWGAVLIVAVSVLFYAQSEVQQSTLAFIWQMPHIGMSYKRVAYITVLNIIIYGVIFIPFCRKKTEFWLAYALFIVLPFVFYGRNYNELIYKASAVCYVVFAALLPELFKQKRLLFSKAIIVFMCVTAVFSLFNHVAKCCSSFGDKEGNVCDPYHGDYYCEQAVLDRKKESGFLPFPTADTPPRILVPFILKTAPVKSPE